MGDVTGSREDTVCESAKDCLNLESLALVDEGKGKAKVQLMLPPLPPKAKRPSEPPLSSESHLVSLVSTLTEPNHSGYRGLSSGNQPAQCHELEDISTESDEALQEKCKKDDAEVTKDLIHMVKGQDVPLSSSDNHSVNLLALKEKMVDAGGNLTQELLDSIGLGKPCSCSFCLKAAHMWMDLTVQDTRGRLSELQKSKKRSADQVARVSHEFSRLSKSSKLELDLLQHWKMIFIRTQETLVQEIAQTRSDLQARSKLMENCKRDLESRGNALRDRRQ